MKRILYKYGIVLVPALLFAVCFISCKKFPSVPEVIEQYMPDSSATAGLTNRRVLLINVDGLRGDTLEKLAPTNITALLSNAKYSFKDSSKSVYFPIDNTSSWASMLTGNAITRVWDSTFYALPDSNNSVPLPLNITVARHIRNKWPKARVTAIGSWDKLVNNLLSDATTKIITGDDAQTKTGAVSNLTTDSALLTVVHLGSVGKAGLQAGFTSGDAAYRSAIQQADANIGEIINAIKARPGYAKENWLIMVTTTQAAPDLLNSRNSNLYIPEFIVAYNKKFKKQNLYELKPPFYPKREDVASNILYWLQVTHKGGIITGTPWLNLFEVEVSGN